MDIERVQDIELLRSFARVQKTQIELLLETLAKKSAHIDALQKGDDDWQKTLALLNKELAEAQADDGSMQSNAEDPDKEKPPKPPRKGHGPRPQPNLPIREDDPYELDEPDQTCRVCGGR